MSTSEQSQQVGTAKEVLTPFKAEDYLFDDASLVHFLTDALNDVDGDLAAALQIAARARGIANLSEVTGLTAEELAAPEIDTLRRVFAVLNLRLEIAPSRDAHE